jgi:hypothetical protein
MQIIQTAAIGNLVPKFQESEGERGRGGEVIPYPLSFTLYLLIQETNIINKPLGAGECVLLS